MKRYMAPRLTLRGRLSDLTANNVTYNSNGLH